MGQSEWKNRRPKFKRFGLLWQKEITMSEENTDEVVTVEFTNNLGNKAVVTLSIDDQDMLDVKFDFGEKGSEAIDGTLLSGAVCGLFEKLTTES